MRKRLANAIERGLQPRRRRLDRIGGVQRDFAVRGPDVQPPAAWGRSRSRLPHLRLPVPAAFASGYDLLAVAVEKDYPVVLLGHRHPRGVWYYFPVHWALKTPVLLLAALVWGLGRVAVSGALWRQPALSYLGLNLALALAWFSLCFATQVGFRFVLMCVPMAALVAAAGLAPLVATRRGRVWLALVAAVSLAENAAYLGNHLAFTSAAVWPKREAFRLVTNSNIDWGQNDEKIGGWLADAGLGAAARDPVHALPGDDVFDLNQLAGVGKFRQHLWLREHLSPRAHFGHTHLWTRTGTCGRGRTRRASAKARRPRRRSRTAHGRRFPSSPARKR